MQDFRPLRVWKKSLALAVNVRKVVSRFPPRGYAELKDQIVRAAESIVSNIVEGCGAPTQKEFARFLSISIKSSTEFEGHLELAHKNAVLPERAWRAMTTEAIDIRRMLHGLRNKVLNSAADAEQNRRSPSVTRDDETHPGKTRGARNRRPVRPPTDESLPDDTQDSTHPG